jgi:integrase
MRHFFASGMIEHALKPKRLQGMLGPSTMAMTLDTYGHLFPDDAGDRALRAAAEAALMV